MENEERMLLVNIFFFLSNILSFADRLVHTVTFCISSTSHGYFFTFFFTARTVLNKDSHTTLDRNLTEKWNLLNKKFELRDRAEVF